MKIQAAAVATILWLASTALGPPVAAAQGLRVDSLSATPGQQVTVTVRLEAGGAQVVGVLNDLSFDPLHMTVVQRPTGRPDCTVNPAIDKPDTAFGFQPPLCAAAECTAIRALVLSNDTDSDPIPDGAVVYTCSVRIALTAPAGVYALGLSGVSLTSSDGSRLCGPGAADPPCAGLDGEVEVVNTHSTEPGIVLSNVLAIAGTVAEVRAFLHSPGAALAGLQTDLRFDPFDTPIVARPDGHPDCEVNPAIGKNAVSFRFQPIGCSQCDVVRAIIAAADNVDPIEDGALIFTCKIGVAAGAPRGAYAIVPTRTIFGSPIGRRVCGSAAAEPPCRNQTGHVIAGPLFSPVPQVILSTAPAHPGESVAVGAFLRTSGLNLAAGQIEFRFDRINTPVRRQLDGSPDCTVNPQIGKHSTSFSFLPPGCSRETCNGVRALVPSTDDYLEPIADGSLLYTCAVDVSPSAAPGPYPLVFGDVFLSFPSGARACGPSCAAESGRIIVGALPAPEPGAAGIVTLRVRDGMGVRGGTVTVSVELANEVPVRALRFDMLVAADALDLHSIRGTERSRMFTTGAVQHTDGTIAVVLMRIGAGVIASGAGPIAEVQLSLHPDVPLDTTIQVRLRDVEALDDDGEPLATNVRNGAVYTLEASPTPPPTATPTVTATPTITATPTVSTTPTLTATATLTATPVPTRPPPCAGDCTATGEVSIDDLLVLVNIALGRAPVNDCSAGDTSGDGEITVDEILTAVSNALLGCPETTR